MSTLPIYTNQFGLHECEFAQIQTQGKAHEASAFMQEKTWNERSRSFIFLIGAIASAHLHYLGLCIFAVSLEAPLVIGLYTVVMIATIGLFDHRITRVVFSYFPLTYLAYEHWMNSIHYSGQVSLASKRIEQITGRS